MDNLMIYPVAEKAGIGGEVNKNGVCIGIDLGTTYSLMATVDPQHVKLQETTKVPVQFVRIRQQSPFPYDQTIEDEKLASIVAIHNGKPYVGNNLYHLKGHKDFQFKKNIFYHWKVEMGVDHHPMYPDAVSDRLDMPFKIAGGILNYMRKAFAGDNSLNNAIVTVPASFQANQRQDTLAAAKMAKITTNENMLIDEPNAAFLGYFNRLTDSDKQQWARDVRNKNVLVIDFGGGTLDLSILNVDFRKDKGITISNRAISRYNDLGGQDLDTLIAEEFLIPKFRKVCKDLDSIDYTDVKDIIIPQLSVIAEDLKIGISDQLNLKAIEKDPRSLKLEEIQYTRRDCKLTYKDEEYQLGDISLKADKFTELFSKIFNGKNHKFQFVDKTVKTVSFSISEIIEKANLTLDEIDYVLFVGGSSYNPLLQSFSKEKLVNSRALNSHEPDKLVAEGAVVYSYFLYTHGISLISPITSDTLGVRLKGDRFYPIIERGQSLPQKVVIPDFKLQSNMTSEVVVPVCINGSDFPIGEIRCPLNDFYDIDTVVKIDASISADKVFKMKVYADDNLIGDAEFDNPYSTGKITEEEREVLELKSKYNRAKREKNRNIEKECLRDLIWKHSSMKNYLGSLECSEEYIRRFDDLDPYVWNMVYIANKRLGRLGAAKRALEKAIEISPDEAFLRYNYSILLESNDPKSALDYLEDLPGDLKEDETVKTKIALLKNDLGLACAKEINNITEEYKNFPESFSDFAKEQLLKKVFDIAGKPYSYVKPETKRRKDDEGKYLDMNNLPF